MNSLQLWMMTCGSAVICFAATRAIARMSWRTCNWMRFIHVAIAVSAGVVLVEPIYDIRLPFAEATLITVIAIGMLCDRRRPPKGERL